MLKLMSFIQYIVICQQQKYSHEQNNISYLLYEQVLHMTGRSEMKERSPDMTP